MTAHWPTTVLSKVCQIKPPKGEARDRVSTDDLVSFLPMEDLGAGEKFVRAVKTKPLSAVVGSYTYFADGDVLLAKITPCFENGKLGIAAGLTNGIGFGSSEYIVLRPNASLSKEWLYYFLSREQFRNEGAARMSGAVGHKRVAKEFIEGCPIPLPPLPEQQRIVRILDEAFEGITTAKANAEKNRQNVRELFESRLNEAFTHRGEAWVELKLEDVVAEDCSLSYGIVQPGDDTENGLPIVRPTDLTEDVVSLAGLKRIDPRRAESYRRTRLKGGEVLLCVRGTTGVVSKAASTLAGANVTRGIVPIRFDPQLLNDGLGLHILRSAPVQAQIRAKTYGAALMQINIKDVRQIQLAVPPPSEQEKIVCELDTIAAETQRLAQVYEQKQAALDALKKSLLHQAFTGEL